MKKVLSCVLCVAMLAAMMIVPTSAGAANKVMLFDDSASYNDANDFGGRAGFMNYSLGDLFEADYGLTLSFDFTLGNTGVCSHPKEPTLVHSSKINFTTGTDSTGIGGGADPYKYFGYNATEDFFYIAYCTQYPQMGETNDGYTYLATSEHGLIKPGVKAHIDFKFTEETGVDFFVDGENVLSFDLYDDLKYAQVMPYESLVGFFTHITCTLDNIAVYAGSSSYDPATGENADDYVSLATFDDVAVTEGAVVDGKWTFLGRMNEFDPTFNIVDEDTCVYCVPFDAEGEGATVNFERRTDKAGAVQSGSDLVTEVSVSGNTGFDKMELRLVNDAFLTVKSVEGMNGITATLSGDTLTLTSASAYTADGAVAKITYGVADVAKKDKDVTYIGTVQGLCYDFGASTVCATNGGADVPFGVNIGKILVYNYTVGDLNNDGKYNLADVTMILKVAAKWDLSSINRFAQVAGDVNADGRTNSLDATYYLKWIAGWKSTPAETYSIGGITN